MDDAPERYPFFSVIVPTRNRPEALAGCLRSLAAMGYPADRYEVLVVDDGSLAPPIHIVGDLNSVIHIRLILQAHAGPAAARNAGAAQAKGQFLAFTDDDCTPRKDWLQAMAAALSEAPDAIIGGPTVNTHTDNVYSTASQLLIDYLHFYYNSERKQARFLTSNNMAVRADRFHAIGGFDVRFPMAAAEDRELCDRWRFHGFRLVYFPGAVVRHAHALDLSTFWRQHYHYGCGAFHFHRLRRHRSGAGLDVEAPSFYMDLLKYPLSRVEPRKLIRMLMLLSISQLANAVGFYRTAMLHGNE